MQFIPSESFSSNIFLSCIAFLLYPARIYDPSNFVLADKIWPLKNWTALCSTSCLCCYAHLSLIGACICFRTPIQHICSSHVTHKDFTFINSFQFLSNFYLKKKKRFSEGRKHVCSCKSHKYIVQNNYLSHILWTTYYTRWSELQSKKLPPCSGLLTNCSM